MTNNWAVEYHPLSIDFDIPEDLSDIIDERRIERIKSYRRSIMPWWNGWLLILSGMDEVGEMVP